MNKLKLTTLFVLICFGHSSHATEISVEQIVTCTTIQADAERLACYDAASLRESKIQETTEVSPKQISSTPDANEPQTAAPLPDDIGGGEFSSGDKEEEKGYRGHVTSCKQASDRRWFYIFENGQVWKQVDRRKRRHRDCDFFVTLTEDNFGYTMEIDGKDVKIRVDRRR